MTIKERLEYRQTMTALYAQGIEVRFPEYEEEKKSFFVLVCSMCGIFFIRKKFTLSCSFCSNGY